MGIELRKPIILVVDDEPDFCEMLVMALSEEGYGTAIASSGKGAIKKVMDSGVDFVLLDIMMPELNGIETLQQIKAIRPELPVVMITGCGTLTTARDAMKYGAYDYITKPFDVECVKEVIKQGLEEQPTNA